MELLARIALMISGICCVTFPVFYLFASNTIFIYYLVIWGFFVVADSPMFSSMIAMAAPATIRGTTLTFVNSIGFLITVISIQSVGLLLVKIDFMWVWPFLAIGPILGIMQFVKRIKQRKL